MSNLATQVTGKLEQVLMSGDLKNLSEQERVSYYNSVCESVGLNPLTRPFEYVNFQGKLVLYARKDCTEQLRKIYRVSVTDIRKEVIGDLLHVTVFGEDSTGKRDLATGVVSIAGLRGVDLANAHMKGETKAKRRFTLSICGLGILDESEIEDGLRSDGPRDVRAQAIEGRLREEMPEIELEPDVEQAPVAAAQAPSLGDYVIPVGKNKGKRLKDLPREKVADFIKWAGEQPSLTIGARNYLKNATDYLAELESSNVA